jgi:hypothetical protein
VRAHDRTMALDRGGLVGLTALKSKLTTMRTLFRIGLGCGIGLFAIRLTSDAQRCGLVDRAPDLSVGKGVAGRARGWQERRERVGIGSFGCRDAGCRRVGRKCSYYDYDLVDRTFSLTQLRT